LPPTEIVPIRWRGVPQVPPWPNASYRVDGMDFHTRQPNVVGLSLGDFMGREYDLFDRTSDGALQWRGFEKGLEEAREGLLILNLETGHDCFAMDISTNEIVASTSGAKATPVA
jgi:hypothetical protein